MKYFVTSDIHSFYMDFEDCLKKSGFEYDNPEHIIIVCGDLFDRGPHPFCTYSFFKSFPKERRILIRGNHEYLLKDIVEKAYPQRHDWSNGTVKTCIDLYRARHPYTKLFKEIDEYAITYFGKWGMLDMHNDIRIFNYVMQERLTEKLWKVVARDIKKSGILDWIFKSNDWVDYYELDKYIFVHSFIPLYISHGTYHDLVRFEPNWRICSERGQWVEASWGCPYSLFDEGYFNTEKEKGKVLVCGHWHASDFHKHYENINERDDSAYIGDNLIALDACTVLSGFCNILVINDDLTLDLFPKFEEYYE